MQITYDEKLTLWLAVCARVREFEGYVESGVADDYSRQELERLRRLKDALSDARTVNLEFYSCYVAA